MKKLKHTLSLALVLVLLMFIGPRSALANNNAEAYDKADSFASILGDAEGNVYATQNGGTVKLKNSSWPGVTFLQGWGFREYEAVPNPGWVWKNWTFEQFHNGVDLKNRTDYFFGFRYSFSKNGNDWRTPYDGADSTISVNRLISRLETRWNKLTYNLYAHFNPTITATADAGGTISPAGGSKASENVTEVNYGENQAYKIEAAEGKMISGITVDDQPIADGKNATAFDYTFSRVVAPHKIHVTFADKKYDVAYEFKSGTEGRDLPQEVLAAKPETMQIVHGANAQASAPTVATVKAADGDWNFDKWEPNIHIGVTETKTFTGIWKFTVKAMDKPKDMPQPKDVPQPKDMPQPKSRVATSPKTGDGTKVRGYLLLLVVSVLMSGLVIFMVRRHKKESEK